jgi:hypothetical protein
MQTTAYAVDFRFPPAARLAVCAMAAREDGALGEWSAAWAGAITLWSHRVTRAVVVLVALLSFPGLVRAEPLRWQAAIAALAAERTRAETCVRLLKRYAGGDAGAPPLRYNGTTTMPGTRVSARDAHVHRLSRCARRDCHAV